MALLSAKGNLTMALEIAKSRFRDTPEVVDVLKAAVAAGTTTDAEWAAPLVQYQNMAGEFAELLRPRTIFGRIEGFRRVPFNIRVPRQTGAGTYGWVGQAKPKPVGELAFDSITMDFAKIAGIIVLTEELARFSSPDAEATVRNDMLKGVAQFLDEQFIDPSVAAVSNISPASITNGAPTVAATGTDAASLLADVNSLFSELAADLDTSNGVWITNSAAVRSVSFMRNPLGQQEFGSVSPGGGTFLGYPVIVSNSVPHDTSGGLLIFVVPDEILVAEDAIVIDASREASVEMSTTPTNPVVAATVMVNLWQHNMIGLKVEKFVNYARRRDDVVGYISGALYGSGELVRDAGNARDSTFLLVPFVAARCSYGAGGSLGRRRSRSFVGVSMLQIQVIQPTTWNGHRKKVGDVIDATGRVEIGCARALVQVGIAIETQAETPPTRPPRQPTPTPPTRPDPTPDTTPPIPPPRQPPPTRQPGTLRLRPSRSPTPD